MERNDLPDSHYDNGSSIAHQVAGGAHRTLVGGMWDEVGTLQRDYLVARGLKRHHLLLDVGCGSLRGGVRFVAYLDPGNYYGVDLNQPLLDAGYDREIVPAGLAARLPRGNLFCFGDFEMSRIGKIFDFAIAQSVFTHLKVERIRDCLARVAPVIRTGGSLHATFWREPENNTNPIVRHPKGINTSGDKDPYHHKVSVLRRAAEGLPWDVEDFGEFAHPRDQQMLVFTRR